MFGHSRPERETLRVLIVDDDPKWRETIIALVAATHGRSEVLACASGGVEALSLMRNGNPYDRVITDTCMDDGSGWYLLTEMYKLYGTGTRAPVYIHSTTASFCTDDNGPIYLPEAIPVQFPGTVFHLKDKTSERHIKRFVSD